MKKCLAVVLALLMLVSAFQIVGFAEKADAALGTTTTGNSADVEGLNNTYGSYLDANSSYKDAVKDIKIPALSYKKANAKIEKIKEQVDENGVKKNDVLKWTGEKGSLTYSFTVEEAGFYEIQMSYLPIAGRGLPLALSFMIHQAKKL